ncbi:MAG TPA: hypothetical protein VMF66_11020 [Candidatus Acidoferrum sp.]|nr:hypothetical protein [Candidatus Acidoferrum sp.]
MSTTGVTLGLLTLDLRSYGETLLIVMLAILGAWAACALIFIGIGSLILKRCGGRVRVLFAFWVGLGLLTAFLEIWNLFGAVRIVAPLLLALVGIWGLVENRSALSQELSSLWTALRWASPLWLGLVVYVAFRLTGSCDYRDTGIYGLTAIRWITPYPVVPGLANLYGRLGFNSSMFLISAALGQVFSSALGFRLVTGLTIVALWSVAFGSCVRLFRNNVQALSGWYFATLSIPAVLWATRSWIVGTATDEAAAVACLIAVGLVLQEIETVESDKNTDESRARAITWATLLAFGVSMKMSTALFAALIWLIGFVKLKPLNRADRRARIALAVIPALLILLPWVAHNIILTGYLFFPSAILRVQVSWSVPVAVANFYSAWIRAAARMPFVPIATTTGTAWLTPWLHHLIRNRGAFQVPAALCVTGVILALISRDRVNLGSGWSQVAWLVAASLAGLVFWFVEAPDPRFAEAPIWSIAAVCAALGMNAWTVGSGWIRTRVAGALLVIATLWAISGFGWQQSYRPPLSVHEIESPKPKLIARRTRSGLVVYQPVGNECWNALLPCTPYFNQTLRLRVSGNMRRGFVSEGMAELPPY